MKEILIRFLSEFPSLSSEDIEQLSNYIVVKEFPKNTEIVRQGESCDKCYFVLKGCLRQFTIIDGIEKNIAFFTEKQAVNYFTNLTGKSSANHYLVTLEDTILMIGNPEKDLEMMRKIPALVALTKQMVEADFGKTQDEFAAFRVSSPEQRYISLTKERPDLIQRVTQIHIASFLGITPESLSRIRKRLVASKVD